MYVDAENELSDAQSVILNDTVTAVSTNAVDLGLAGRDVGNGIPLYLVVSIQTAMVGAGATLEVELLSDDAATLASSPVSHGTFGIFGAASAAGTVLVIPVPPTLGSANDIKRYLGCRFGAAGGNITAGAVDAFFTNTPQKYDKYAKSYTIS